MDYVHPLARVKGSGSARSGVHHWWMQRLTAIALVPLTIWFVGAMLGLTAGDQPTLAVRAWLAEPLNGVLLLSWVTAMIYHGQLGMQVIIEDYVHHHVVEVSLQIINKLVAVLAILMTVVTVFKLISGDAS